MDTRASYDAVAERYAAELGDELAGKPLDRALLDLVLELADGGPVADLGAGPGHVAGWLAARGGRVVALDLSPQMCRLAPVPAVAVAGGPTCWSGDLPPRCAAESGSRSRQVTTGAPGGLARTRSTR